MLNSLFSVSTACHFESMADENTFYCVFLFLFVLKNIAEIIKFALKKRIVVIFVF
jgi:hypothetical protein